MLAIFGDHGDAAVHRFADGASAKGQAADGNSSRIGAVGAEDAARDFRSSGANQSRHTDDFAGADLQGNVAKNSRAREILHVQQDWSARRRSVRRVIDLQQLAPDHELDQLLLAHLADRAGRDVFPVAQHRHPIGQFENLIQPVADIQNAHALAPELADEVEQDGRLALRQRRRRLIHHQQPAILRQRPRHANHLPLRDRQSPDGPGRVKRVGLAEALEQSLRFATHCRAIEHQSAELPRLAADEDVVECIKVREGHRFLMDHRDPGALTGGDVARLQRRTADQHRPAVGHDRPSQDLDQRRFARAVLPAQRVHLAGGDLDAHARQRVHPAVGFAHLADFDEGGIRH